MPKVAQKEWMIMEVEGVFLLYDDESVKKKLTVMSKWDAMIDDARNPDIDWSEMTEEYLQVGKSYKVKIIIEEIT